MLSISGTKNATTCNMKTHGWEHVTNVQHRNWEVYFFNKISNTFPSAEEAARTVPPRRPQRGGGLLGAVDDLRRDLAEVRGLLRIAPLQRCV